MTQGTMKDRMVGDKGNGPASSPHHHCPTCGGEIPAGVKLGAVEFAPTPLSEIVIEDAPRRGLPWGMMALAGAAGLGLWWYLKD